MGRKKEPVATTLSGSETVSDSAECGGCRIGQEADHRIANHLTLLAGFVRMKATDLARRPEANGAEAQLVLGAISSQIIAIGRLHRSLSAQAGQRLDLSEYLHEACVLLPGLRDSVQIVEDFHQDCVVPAEHIPMLTQIVSEVLTNAVKYAASQNSPTLIKAACFRDKVGRVQLEITDNGRGLPEGFDPMLHGGLGFRLLRGLAKQLEARIEFQSSGNGVRFRLTLPAY